MREVMDMWTTCNIKTGTAIHDIAVASCSIDFPVAQPVLSFKGYMAHAHLGHMSLTKLTMDFVGKDAHAFTAATGGLASPPIAAPPTAFDMIFARRLFKGCYIHELRHWFDGPQQKYKVFAVIQADMVTAHDTFKDDIWAESKARDKRIAAQMSQAQGRMKQANKHEALCPRCEGGFGVNGGFSCSKCGFPGLKTVLEDVQ
jgi:hypothetical protein